MHGRTDINYLRRKVYEKTCGGYANFKINGREAWIIWRIFPKTVEV
jgi:hypothetical protein